MLSYETRLAEIHFYTLRGDDTIALFTLMERLREQASAVGGTVLSHLGNHEWMNAIGDWRYICLLQLFVRNTV